MLNPILAAGSADLAPLFIELGLIFAVLAIAARLASAVGISPIPLFLLTGLVFGGDGLYPVHLSEPFIETGAEIGVILLLFMLGLEYSADELSENLRASFGAGVIDLVLNFLPGFVLGLLLGWELVAALLLGGVTYISSSGIISKLLSDLGWLGNRETPVILSMLVFEDLVMAVYLPLMTVLLVGAGLASGLISLGVALVTVIVIALVAFRFGGRISGFVSDRSNEIVLLTVLGLTLLVGGIAQRLEVSAAVGAFLVGIALNDTVSERVHEIISPLKDLFAAVFFVFFGLQITPSELPPVLLLALALGVVSGLTKLATGIIAARQQGIGRRGQVRAGTMLMIRGEFSIVIAGLATTAGLNEPTLAPLTAAYVLLMAIVGPLLIRLLNPIFDFFKNRAKNRRNIAAPVEVRETSN